MDGSAGRLSDPAVAATAATGIAASAATTRLAGSEVAAEMLRKG